MKLIVGLGNPGSQYSKTRHNAGFMVIDRLALRHGLENRKAKFDSNVQDCRIAGHHCLLLEPMTFMNRCGSAVRQASLFFKLDPAVDLMIIVDDVALPIGQIRLRLQGGTGGHNGLADIERALGTRKYPRLRIGIDRPADGSQQVNYVLGHFTAQQLTLLSPALDRACDAIDCWLRDGMAEAMTNFNSATT